jgi:hypothetical protein
MMTGVVVEVVPFEVEVATFVDGILNGACWGTLRFVMLRDIEADGPEYPHRIGLIPHVNISPIPTKNNVGVALADAELLEVVGVVGVVRMDPTTLMVDEAVEDERERETAVN